MSIVELTMVKIFGSFLLPGGIISTLWTNPQEASEFYNTNLHVVWHWIPIIILCIAACILFQKPNKYRLRYPAYIGLLILPVLFVTYKLTFFYDKSKGKGITLRYFVDNRVWNRPPYNVCYSSIQAYKILQHKEQIEHAKDVNFGAYRPIKPEAKEIYVLAIGESLRYDNVSLNGKYHRSTTPKLEALENLVLFHNYYSQACLTMFSVPMMITRAIPSNYELNFAERSIVEPYRECGFKTFVVTSKTNLLSYETYLSNGCDSLIIVPNIVENGEIISGDKTIVHIIDSLANEHDKLFVMCQFLGNHCFFTNYDSACDVYHPNSNDKGIERSTETLTNAYDNTILYTDYILSSIIQSINRKNTVSALLFAPDHGETINGAGAGHGASSSPPKTEYHVPLIFWWSDAYATMFPDKIEAAKEHQHAKINGDCIFYTLNDMGGIRIDSSYNEPTWDILSSEFMEHERLILVPDGVNTFNPDK